MQEVLLKNFDLERLFDASYQVIHNRKFDALGEIEVVCNDILDSVSLTNDSYSTAFLFPLYYIYYCILSEKDREIFPSLRKIIITYNDRLVTSYPAKEELNNFYNTDMFDSVDIEDKYLYELCMNILNKYDASAGFISKDRTEEDKFDLGSKLMKSIYINQYTNIRDDFYFILMLGFTYIDYKKLEPQAYEKFKVKLFETALGVIIERGENSDIDANLEFQEILNQANEIQF